MKLCNVQCKQEVSFFCEKNTKKNLMPKYFCIDEWRIIFRDFRLFFLSEYDKFLLKIWNKVSVCRIRGGFDKLDHNILQENEEKK